jgi:hypothetical protein
LNLGSGVIALFTDPTYGIPLVVALGLAVAVGWWSRARTAALPSMTPGSAPEIWRMQLDALAYFNLQEGRYLAAVDGLGRRLGVVVRDRFHVQIAHPSELDASSVDELLPHPLTLRGLVQDLRRAYNSAAWAEEPGWLTARWPWLKRRQERRARKDFTLLTTRISAALSALEAE